MRFKTRNEPVPSPWQRMPFLIISVALATGMIGQTLAGLACHAALATVLIAAVLMRSYLPVSATRRVITCSFIALLGAVAMFTESQQPSLPEPVSDNSPLRATVVSCVNGANSTRAVITRIPGKQRLVAYLPLGTSLKYGDTLITTARPHPIPAPSLPWCFDVADFYRKQGIHQRVFIKDNVTLRPRQSWHLKRWSTQTRDILSSKLTTLIKDPDNRNVLMAMLLGVRDGLPQQTRDAFARSGTIHILAISGLHIGIIASLLILILGKPKAGQSTLRKVIRCLLLLAGIWTFTLISGMAPSAVRAVFMFSIYCLGQIWDRQSNGLNILGFSAFVILLIEPRMLFSVSFQFSYLALIGILVFGRAMYRAIAIKPRFLRMTWGVLSISVGAQVLLIPASIHYFNQVSLISPLMSLLAIPMAYLIVGGGVALLMAAFALPVLAPVVGSGLSLVLGCLNAAVDKTATWTGSAATDLYFPEPVLPLLYAGLIALLLFHLTKHGRWVVCATCAGMLSILAISVIGHQRQHASTLTVFPGQADFLIDCVSGTTCFTTIDSTLTPFESDLVARSRRYKFVDRRNVQQLDLSKTTNQVVEFGGIRCALWRDELPMLSATDYLVIGKGVEPRSLQSVTINPRQAILSRSLDYRSRAALQQTFAQRGVPTHCLRYDGPFELRIHHKTDHHDPI